RSDHYLKMGNVSGQPGPTDAWATLAGLAAETSRIRLGTLVTCATFRLPGPLAVTVAQVDAMSGGRGRFRLGAGWLPAGPAVCPAADGTLRPARRAACDQPRAVGAPSGPAVLLRWHLLPGHGLARAAQAGSAPASSGHRGGCRTAPHAGAGRQVRRRVQREF